MALLAEVRKIRGRPMLVLNGEPTGELWCFGDPNAIEDFSAAQVRICQFYMPVPSWWTGAGQYDFAALDAKVEAFLAKAPRVRLMPRVAFGFQGERWWAERHPDEIARGRDLNGQYTELRAASQVPVECPYSSGSELWSEQAGAALAALVTHCEERWPDNIIGYQLGGGITAEWFRWWAFIDGAYEDYSPAAARFFRQFLRRRYGDDDGLRRAWRQPGITIEQAEAPHPKLLRQPRLGFFRDPAAERSVIDWLECLNAGNVGQLISLAAAAKRACRRAKLVGAFFGYLWPHWNTQNPARSGHLHLHDLLTCADIDFISSPYHYDNRHVGGVHHAQTVVQAVERAGKLHLTELDAPTHLASRAHRIHPWIPKVAESRAESLAFLRRDAAAVLGTGGTGWWMDLRLERWYEDRDIQRAVGSYQHLAKLLVEHPAGSRADVALVIDDKSYAYCDLHSPLNQYFTSLPRQCLWSDLGFPLDALLLSEVADTRPYRVYVFLNAWRVDAAGQTALAQRLRQPGVTAVWFYGAGFFGGEPGVAGVSKLVEMEIGAPPEATSPEVVLAPDWRAQMGLDGRGALLRYGARPDAALIPLLLHGDEFRWEVDMSPQFVVRDSGAMVLGRYAETDAVGVAMVERDGWRSFYSAVPLLPGAVLRAIAERAGVHLYSHSGCTVHHRGPLLSITTTAAGRRTVSAPPGSALVRLLSNESTGEWEPRGDFVSSHTFDAEIGQTEFFWCRQR